MQKKLYFIVALLGLIGCRADEPAVSNGINPDTVRGVIDSIFPVEEDIRRFKAARDGVAANELAAVSSSRDSLVARFMQALERRDTADLRAMAINAGEFIDLYYPSSIYSHPPYKQSPEITWLLMQQHGEKGLRRAVERFGGVPPNLQGYECASAPRVEGSNRYWEGCVVRWSPTPEAPGRMRIFGSIMERAGRFKFVSFANDL